jgi:hypothetical protein
MRSVAYGVAIAGSESVERFEHNPACGRSAFADQDTIPTSGVAHDIPDHPNRLNKESFEHYGHITWYGIVQQTQIGNSKKFALITKPFCYYR